MADQKIRCPDCGRKVVAAAAVCPGCKASLLQLCQCGATALMSAATCAACGDGLRPPSFRPRPVGLRAIAAVLLLALVATASAAFWNAYQRRERKSEIWRLSDEAFAAVKERRFADALPLLTRYLEDRPRDPQMLYLLAVSEHESGDDPMAGVPAARRALEVDGSFSEAAGFLAAAYEAQGDVERALHFARRAVAGSRPTPELHSTIALLELQRARPDIAVAIAALETALSGAAPPPRLVVLLALLELRRAGYARIETLPAGVIGRVARAEEIVFGDDSETADEPFIRVAAIELTLARGQAAAARRLSERLIADPQLAAEQHLRARLLLGRAALLEDDRAAARAAFERAIADDPSAATASEVARAYRDVGDPSTAIDLLAAVAAGSDGDPGVQDTVAALRASVGDLDGALAILREQVAARGDDARLRLQLGDLLAASGDLDAADAQYAAAEQLGGRADAQPTLRRAQIAVSRVRTVTERRAAAVAASQRLDERWGDPRAWEDAEALDLRGRLAVVANRPDEAVSLLRRAVELAPRDARARISLAEAEIASGDADGLALAGGILREAAELAPFDEPSVVQVARLLLALGDARQAHSVCQRLLDRVGDRAAVLDVDADALRRMGRWEDAALRLRQLRATTRGASAQVAHKLLDSLLRSGATDAARQLVEQVDPERRDGRLSALIALHGATPAERLERLLADGPGLELAYAQLAIPDRDAALATLRSALAETPGATDVRRTLVLLLLEEPEPVAARAEVRQLIDGLGPDARPAERDLLVGALALSEGRPEAAREPLERAAVEAPDDPFVCLFHGRALFASGEHTAALAPLRRAAVLPGALPGFATVLSRCLHEVARGTDDAAQREALLWEALQHDTASVGATADLVNLLFETGREEEAARLARRLLATGAAPPELALGLRRLAVAAALRATGLDALLPLVDEFPFDDRAGVDRLLDALLLLGSRRDVEALRLIREVDERHARSPIVVIATVEALVRLGDVGSARTLATEADGAAGSRYRMAFLAALLRTRLHAEVLAESQTLAEAEPANEDLVAMRVRAALQLGEDEIALELVRTAEAASEGAAAVRLRLLRSAVLGEIGRAGDALALARGVALAPDAEPELRSAVRIAEAEALLRLRRFDEAARRIEGLAEPAAQAAVGSPRQAARLAFVRGTLAMVQSRTEDAVRLLREALRDDPGEAAAANNLAWLFSTRPSRAAEALRLARTATDLEPRNPDFWDTRAACARQAGVAEEAERCWNRALELLDARAGAADAARLRAEARLGLAELLAAQSRFDEAVRLARRVLDSAPAPETARRARAVLRLR